MITRQEERIALMVLGMHRSGTSALGGTLVRLGVREPLHLMPEDQNNSKGYYESSVLTDFHDQVLSELGTSWDDPRPLDQAWLAGEAGRRRVDELVHLMDREYPDCRYSLVKDPRLCRIFPLWEAAAGKLGLDIRVAMPVRHPREVAASLGARDAMDNSRALALWLVHQLEAERFTRSTPRVFTRFSDLLADWRSVAATVASALEIDWSAGWQNDSSVDDYLAPELRHHAAEEASTPADGQILELAMRVFRALDGAVGSSGDAALSAELDSVRAELEPLLLLAPSLVPSRDPSHEAEVSRLRASLEALRADHRAELARVEAGHRAGVLRVESDRRSLENTNRQTIAELTERASAELAKLKQERAVIAERLELRSLEVAELTRALLKDRERLAARTASLHDTRLRLRAFRQELIEHARVIRGLRGTRSPLAVVRRRMVAGQIPGDEVDMRRLLKRSELFNAPWYLDANPDVRSAGMDPAVHYLRYGAKEGRDPGPAFSTAQYLRRNRDVRETGVNPLVHFLAVGRAEGRTWVRRNAKKGRASDARRA